MKKILVLTYLFGAMAFNSIASAERPTATVETGSLQGTTEYNMNVFKNIPYAAPPVCLLYTSPSPRDTERSRMPSSA